VRRSNGGIGEARVGMTNMGTVPVRAHATEAALVDADLDGIAAAAEQAAEGTTAPSDINASTEFREHLARVLTRRALEAAAG
jgi:aerobic carbon-monoxide dehydrogenase medium subunit